MKKSMKYILVMLLVLALTSSLGACNAKTKEENPSDKERSLVSDEEKNEKEEITTLTFLVDKDTAMAGFEAVAKAAETKLNIKIQIETRPGGAEGENLVKTRLATGDAPDLILFNAGALLAAVNPAQNFMDLSEESFISRIDDGFTQVASVDGKLYGIPLGSSTVGGWLYNKKIYEELGLSIPKTWKQLLDNCQKIKEANKTPVIGSYKDDWTSQLILLSDYYNVHAAYPEFEKDFTMNKAKFATTPSALRGFEKLQEINTLGYLNDDYLATTYDVALQMLVEGDGVHFPMLTFALSAIEENYPEEVENIGVFPQPSDDESVNGFTVWYQAGIYASKNSSQQEAIKKFMDFYISDEGVGIYAAVSKAVGPYNIIGVDLPDDSFTAVKEMMSYFEAGKTYPALEFVSPVKGPNAPQICIECGSNIKSAVECAAAYDADVLKQAKQLGLEGW